MLDHQFNACDRNVDHKLDPDELLQCTEKNITMKNHRPYHISELHILRSEVKSFIFFFLCAVSIQDPSF